MYISGTTYMLTKVEYRKKKLCTRTIKKSVKKAHTHPWKTTINYDEQTDPKKKKKTTKYQWINH